MNKKYKFVRGKADLNSNSGNYLSGAILKGAKPEQHFKDFQKRRNDAIREIELDGKCLIRLDSGNDAAKNFDALGDEHFIIKRNLRKESKEQCLAMARRVGDKVESRDGKNVYVGEVSHKHPGNDQSRPLT